MNILIVNQSVIDMCASFFTLLTAVVEVDGTHMSSGSVFDQFLCHFWLSRQPLFSFLGISIYGILLMALERYISVVHPIWQNNNVRTSHGSNISIVTALYCMQRGLSYCKGVSPSVRPSLCPPRAWLVTKRTKVPPTFLYHMKGKFMYFFGHKEWLVGDAPST